MGVTGAPLSIEQVAEVRVSLVWGPAADLAAGSAAGRGHAAMWAAFTSEAELVA